MIIVKLQGGLGNQLFQYATGLAISLRSGMVLKIDLEWYKRNTDRKFLIDRFNTVSDFASALEIQQAKGVSDTWFIKFLRKLGIQKSPILEESDSYRLRSLKPGQPVYMRGYWQSPAYFEEYANEIMTQFSLKQWTPPVLELKILIESAQSVGVHIRRGDYVSNPASAAFHGVLEWTYYEKALALLKERYGDFICFVFSDDHVYAKQKFEAYSNTYFISGLNDEEELILLSRCKHQIIANSTFSWWAAWLNPNPDKVVIAPRLWFADAVKNTTTDHLLPATWIRL